MKYLVPGIFTLLIALFVSCSNKSEPEEQSQLPNIVIIYLDDLGYGDMSAYKAGTLKTPNMDMLANGGVRFTNGYAACQVCSPSRASIMTGKYTPRHGITDWIGAKEGFDWKRNTKLLPAKYNWRLGHDEDGDD